MYKTAQSGPCPQLHTPSGVPSKSLSRLLSRDDKPVLLTEPKQQGMARDELSSARSVRKHVVQVQVPGEVGDRLARAE